MWLSSQVTLIALTGMSGLISEPESTRSVALTVALLTGLEKFTITEFGGRGDVERAAVGDCRRHWAPARS